jgi:hypothetical protein
MEKFDIFIPTNNLMLAQQAKNCISAFNPIIFNGNNYPSFSKLINDCILAAENEIVIIVNQKIRATPLHINKMLYLINKGYGLVCLQNFHFFGFKKDLIRTIGFFDERFEGGGCEDADIIRRLIEHKIGWYDSTETNVLQMKSTWNSSKAYEFFYTKWKDGKIERLLEDEKPKYNLGEEKSSSFLPLSSTVLSKTNKDYFDSINFNFSC